MTVGQIALGIVGAVVGYFTGGAGWYLVGAVMVGAAAGVAVGGMIDPASSDVPSPGSPEMSELDVPSIDEGVPIYDLLGTSRCVGEIFWYGLDKTVPIIEKQKSGKGGGKSTKQVVGYKYYLSWAQGICLGPVDTLFTVLRDEEVMWAGELDRPVSGGEETITIGEMGSMTLYFGTDDQVASSKIGGEVGANVNPSYRGLCYAFFDNCFIGNFNRAPRMRFIIQKRPSYGFNASHEIGDYDYNPAHAIYHILTSPYYVGFPTTWINESSFSDFADGLHTEDHGLSLLYTRQEPALRSLEGILTHVGAVMKYGIDGKFHLHALRADDPILDLPEVTQDTFLEPMVLERKGWPDVVNEVQVQHHVRYNILEQEPTVYYDPNDDFTGEDGSAPDTGKWTQMYGTHADIQGNRMHTNTAEYSGVTSVCEFVGDFDFQVDYDYSQYTLVVPNSSAYNILLRIYEDAQNYAAVIIGYIGAGGPAMEFAWNSAVGGSHQSGLSLPAAQIGKLRMVRTGTTLYCYVWANLIDTAWRLVHTRTGFNTENVRPRLYSSPGGTYQPEFDVYWDNFTVNSPISSTVNCSVPPDDPFALNIRRAAVTADDRGTAEIHGRAITKSVQLIGFGSTENANWAAERAVRRAAYPFAEGQLTTNRYLFKYEIGDLFRLSDSEHNISNMACRVMQIAEGPLESETISVGFMEEPDYVTQSATLAEMTSYGSKRGYDLEALTHVDMIEAPYIISGYDIRLLPLASRENGKEVGYEIYYSIDGGASYQFLDDITYYAIYGELVSELSIDVLTLDKVTGFEVDFYFDEDASLLETVTRAEMFNNQNMAVLGDEILNFETVTPDGVVEGRYKIDGLNRGRIDSIRKTWPASTPIWVVGTTAIQVVADPAFLKGASLKFKMVPYNAHSIGDISEAIEVDYDIVGRARAPYVPGNFNKSGKSTGPLTYGKDVYLTWDPRVRGLDAGVSDPDSVIDYAATHEGKFEVKVYDSGDTLVRTATEINEHNWTYTEAMNLADNVSLESTLTFQLDNYIVAGGVTYTNIHSRTMEVNLVSSTTTTTTTTTTTV